MFTLPTTPTVSTTASVLAASAASAASSAADSTESTAAVAKKAVLNANIAAVCAMEAINKAAAAEASRRKAMAMVTSIRHAKAAAMAASAVAINAVSKKGFIETALSLEKQARGMEALIEEQVNKEVDAANHDSIRLHAVAKTYTAAATDAAMAAKMRFRTSTVLRYEVLDEATDPGFVYYPRPTSMPQAHESCSTVD